MAQEFFFGCTIAKPVNLNETNIDATILFVFSSLLYLEVVSLHSILHLILARPPQCHLS